jgi:hypothetical protein
MVNISTSEDSSGGDRQKQPFKQAFLHNNITEIISLLNKKISPTSEELLFILSHNHQLADYIALKNVNGLKSILNISA